MDRIFNITIGFQYVLNLYILYESFNMNRL